MKRNYDFFHCLMAGCATFFTSLLMAISVHWTIVAQGLTHEDEFIWLRRIAFALVPIVTIAIPAIMKFGTSFLTSFKFYFTIICLIVISIIGVACKITFNETSKNKNQNVSMREAAAQYAREHRFQQWRP